MKLEILLASGVGRKRGAVITDGSLSDYRGCAEHEANLVGAVYRARIKRKLAGLAAAIVESPEGEAWLDLTRARDGAIAEGAMITVQIVAEGHGGKLPRASTEILLAGRFLAFQPGAAKPRLSHRIVDNSSRARLGAALAELSAPGKGQFLALRRAAEAKDEALRFEARRLRRLWDGAQAALARDEPDLAIPAPDAVLELLRLFVGPALLRIAADSEALAGVVRAWLAEHAPDWKGVVEREPIGRTKLESAEIREQLEAALAPEVALPSGGVLTISPAAGLTAIDVDTERAAGLSASATFARVNREAAVEIARQIRLRNLGGRIVIDFAGLGAGRQLPSAVAALRAAVADDPMAVQIAPPSSFGLVELLRRRERRTLAEMLGAG